jgi:hypothetical protein
MSPVENARAAVLAAAVGMNKALSETAQSLLKLLDKEVDLMNAMEANTRKIYNSMRVEKSVEKERLVEPTSTLKRK